MTDHIVSVGDDFVLPAILNTTIAASAPLVAVLDGKVEKPAASRNSLTGWFHANGFGIFQVNSAATNDAAFVTALAAVPLGGTLYIPPGKYQFNTITPVRGINIRGGGANVNARLRYGDATWLTTAAIGGTFLVSNKTTAGGAITIPPTESFNASTISDIAIIGPGSGSSTGLVLGGSGGGYPVRVRLRNLSISNFSVGFLGSNENSQFDALSISGCYNGFTTMYPFNGNVINGLDVEYCDNIAVKIMDARSNVFNGGVFQGNYGPKVFSLETNLVETANNTFIGPYLENTGPADWQEISIGLVGSNICAGNSFIGVECDSLNTNTPTIRFGPLASRNTLVSDYVCCRVQLDSGAGHNKIAVALGNSMVNNSGQITNRIDNTTTGLLQVGSYLQFMAMGTTDLPTLPYSNSAQGLTVFDKNKNCLVSSGGLGSTWYRQDGSPAARGHFVSDLPDNALAQSYERRASTLSHGLTSGKPSVTAIYLDAGMTVTSITLSSAATAMAGGTHGWAALYSPAMALLVQSANDTGITWAANTDKTFTLTTPRAITASGWYYVMCGVTASTANNVAGNVTGGVAPTNRVPIMGGAIVATGIVGTAPATFAVHAGYLNSAPYVTVQ